MGKYSDGPVSIVMFANFTESDGEKSQDLPPPRRLHASQPFITTWYNEGICKSLHHTMDQGKRTAVRIACPVCKPTLFPHSDPIRSLRAIVHHPAPLLVIFSDPAASLAEDVAYVQYHCYLFNVYQRATRRAGHLRQFKTAFGPLEH